MSYRLNEVHPFPRLRFLAAQSYYGWLSVLEWKKRMGNVPKPAQITDEMAKHWAGIRNECIIYTGYDPGPMPDFLVR